MALAAVVASQVGNLFAHRSEPVSLRYLDWLSNPLLLGGVVTELILVVAAIYLPPFQQIFGTAAIPISNWLLLIMPVPLLPLVDEVRKGLSSRIFPAFGQGS